MPDSPNKLSQFWQELKRRKVIRVITVYAAAAFVILELVSIIVEPLRLPEWFLPMVIVLLCIGFIIAIILSWVYDIHPEGGIVKTEPARKVKKEDVHHSSSSWKIASYISFVVIVALIVLNIIPRSDRADEVAILQKSIAVLPFINDSPDQENEYFINGTMESILNNLCKIEDLRVISRSSVEQYRDTIIYIPDVAEKLMVSYVLEGSMQKYGNHIRMTLQLIDQSDKHLWAEQYDREIIKVEELLTLQSEIAQLVAREIKAVITPEEQQLIEKIPTTSLTAYDFYQRGREEQEQFWLDKYWLDNDNKGALERAENFYYRAMEYDSTFAQAYTGLALVYWNKHYWEEFLTENFLDSVLILADIALSFDDQLSEAYVIKGNYFSQHNNKEQALIEYDRAIKYNPNEWMAYFGKGSVYESYDLVNAIDNTHKAILLHRGSFLPMLLRSNGFNYAWAGFKEKAFYCESEALALDGDSAWYYDRLASYEDVFGNFEETIKYAEKSLAIDSTNWWIIYLMGLNYCYLDRNEEYLEYLKKFEKRSNTLEQSDFFYPFRIGHAYWANGFKEEAEIYFNRGWELYNEALDIRIPASLDIMGFYYPAAINSFFENKDKAYEYLGLINQSSFAHLWLLKDLNNDPLFDNIRDEPEFQQIVRDVETKYQALHERVRQWLEENNML